MNSPKARTDCLFPAILFCVILAVYVFTLCPTVYWEDAGELITASYVLGIAHPPGHPLYTILGHLFSLIPFGSIAWRVNLMSALFGALASVLVYPAVLQLINEQNGSQLLPVSAAAAASLFAAFGVTLWDQAVVAETSTLHAFFFMILLVIFLQMLRLKDESAFPRWLFAFSFVYGLSLTNHVAGVFLMPAFALWALIALHKQILELKRILLSLCFFCLGLSVYLYLPLRSMQDPIIDWGNPETLANFWWVVTAEQFKQNVFSQPRASQLIHGLVYRLSDIRQNFMVAGCMFICFGAWACFRRRKDFLLFAVAVVGVLGAVTLNPAFISAYFIPALLVMAVLAGIGAEAAARAFISVFNAPKVRLAVSTLVASLIMLSPALVLARHYPLNDRSNYYLARDYGTRILDALPPGAAFFTIDINSVFTLWYLQYCEGKRPDVLVIEPTWLANSSSMRADMLHRCPNVALPEAGVKVTRVDLLGENRLFDKDLLYAILEKNAKVRPVYWGAMPVFESLRPQGLIYRFVGDEEEVLSEQNFKPNQEFWAKMIEDFLQHPSLMRDRVASLVYPETLRHQAIYFSKIGKSNLAQWAFEQAIRINPLYARAWLGLGELYMQKGMPRESLLCLELAGNLDYQVSSSAHFKRGTIYYDLAQYQEASDEFAKVIRNDDRYPGVHNMVGSIRLRTNLVDEAEKEFRKEILLNPSTPGAYSNLAQILIQEQHLDEAGKLLIKGAEIQPGLWQNYYFLAQIQSMRGDSKKAKELLLIAIRTGGPVVSDMAKKDPSFRGLTEASSLGT